MTARRSAATGTGRMWGGCAASPSSVADQRGERAAEPAAREGRHRAVAEEGLAPPPLARELAAPVLLDVAVPAVERDGLAAEHHLAGRMRVVLRRGRGVVLRAESAVAGLEHGRPGA